MGRRSGAGDEEHPDVGVHTVAFVGLAPAQIVQRVFRRKTQLAPQFIRDQPVQAGAFVHFIEVRQRFTRRKAHGWLRPL